MSNYYLKSGCVWAAVKDSSKKEKMASFRKTSLLLSSVDCKSKPDCNCIIDCCQQLDRYPM